MHLRADGAAAAHAQASSSSSALIPTRCVQVVRVLAEGLSHAAEVMRYTALATILQPGATELEIAQASQALVSRIAPLLGPMIQDMLFMQLRHMMETEAVNASERAAGAPLPGARHITAAFADLVGFTRLGEEVPPEELGQLANRLADLARDVAVPPVRFVKTIGDAAMFVCTEPAPLLDAVLKLVDITDSDDDFPRLRAGIASGSAVSRAGDWFGSPVNIASRVTAVSRPGAVLAAESVREELGDYGGLQLVVRGRATPQGDQGRGEAVPRPPRRGESRRADRRCSPAVNGRPSAMQRCNYVSMRHHHGHGGRYGRPGGWQQAGQPDASDASTGSPDACPTPGSRVTRPSSSTVRRSRSSEAGRPRQRRERGKRGSRVGSCLALS